jgi:hypothetical protein
MTASKKEEHTSKEVMEEEVPEVEIPPSQVNLEGGTSDSIAPEQLEQALLQQANSIVEEPKIDNELPEPEAD